MAYIPGSNWIKAPQTIVWYPVPSVWGYLASDDYFHGYYQDPDTLCDLWIGTIHGDEYRAMSKASLEALLMSFLRRSQSADKIPAGPGGPVLTDIKEVCPAVYEYLTATRYPDGEARQTSTLLIVVDPDGLKGCLNDRQEGRTLWVTSETVMDLIAALEACLTSSRPNWRASTWKGQNQGKKQK